MLFSRSHQFKQFKMPRNIASNRLPTGSWDRVQMGQFGWWEVDVYEDFDVLGPMFISWDPNPLRFSLLL